MKKRYVFTCVRILPEKRDISHAYGESFDELNPDEPVGGLAQNAVDLDEEGYAAYTDRERVSNLIHIEEVVEASVDGWVEEPVKTRDEDMTLAGVQRIPADEDTAFLKSLFMRQAQMTGEGVKVAVLDTAMGAAVARWLRPNIAGARSFTGQSPSGGNALAGTHSHGTHVACLALPDDAMLLMGEVLGPTGGGTSDAIIKGIYWAVNQGAHIIIMSLSGNSGLNQYEPALRYARSRGVLVYCAAGNEAQRGNPKRYPAACPSAIAVAAFDRRNARRAPFSSYHTYVDFAASGVNVLSYLADGRMGRMSGTSQATPLVGWVSACLLSRHGSTRAVLQALGATATDTPAPATHEGVGIVNGREAHKKLAADKNRAA